LVKFEERKKGVPGYRQWSFIQGLLINSTCVNACPFTKPGPNAEKKGLLSKETKLKACINLTGIAQYTSHKSPPKNIHGPHEYTKVNMEAMPKRGTDDISAQKVYCHS
jgi:hypothetical protein